MNTLSVGVLGFSMYPTSMPSTDEKLRSNQGRDVQNPENSSGFQLFAIILALCLAEFFVALDRSVVATAIPTITDQFNSVLHIGWYGSVSAFSHFIISAFS
jgi:hypothetical protein